MNEWTDEMQQAWDHHKGDILTIFQFYRRVYGPQGERGASNVDWRHAGICGDILRYIVEHNQPPARERVA